MNLLIIPLGVIACFKKPQDTGEFPITVRMPIWACIIGCVGSAVFTAFAILSSFSTDFQLWTAVIFLLFSCLGNALVIAFINCRIVFDENGFTHKSFIGIKKHYTYGQVTGINEGIYEDYIFVGKKQIAIPEMTAGGAVFLGYVIMKYRELHNRKSPPTETRYLKFDLFKGHIKDHLSFPIVYILLIVLSIVFSVLMVHYIFFSAGDASDSLEISVNIIDHYYENKSLTLLSEEGTEYTVLWIKDEERIAELKALRGEDGVTVYVDADVAEDAQSYSVNAVSRNGEFVLSFEDVAELHRKEYVPLIAFPIIFDVFLVGFPVLSVIVGRNPSKYRRWVKYFFRPDYVRY